MNLSTEEKCIHIFCPAYDRQTRDKMLGIKIEYLKNITLNTFLFEYSKTLMLDSIINRFSLNLDFRKKLH